MKLFGVLLIAVILSGCASQPTVVDPASIDEFRALRQELQRLGEAADGLSRRLSRLETNIDASSPDGEHVELTIDAVKWPEDLGMKPEPKGSHRRFFCHPVEWRGFGKMKRFTMLADSHIYLESDEEPPIDAFMNTGGMCNESGSVRFVVLSVPDILTPGVSYRLRPRNDNERYRWSVNDDVVVTSK